MSKIMGKRGRSRGPSWKKLVWSSFSRIVSRKTMRRRFIGAWMGESNELRGRDRLWPIPFWPSWFYQFWPIHFWPSWFWPGQFWPKPIFANPILANPILANLFLDLVCVMVAPQRVCGQTQRKVGPRRVGPRRVGNPKFRAFFPFPATVFILFSLSCWSFSWNFGGVWSAGTLKCARLEFSGCCVKPRQIWTTWHSVVGDQSQNGLKRVTDD